MGSDFICRCSRFMCRLAAGFIPVELIKSVLVVSGVGIYTLKDVVKSVASLLNYHRD